MKIVPLAADSLGTRSMATWVELEGVRVLIDPGVTVAETRYGLPPMQEERQALEAATSRVIGALCQADAAVVTHFHEEHVNLLHYVLSSTAIYMKTPVTPSEVRATQALFPRLERTGRAFSMADDSSVNLRDVTLTFSRPLPHGKAGAKAGSVMAVAVQARSGCFVHASDVQGPLSAAAVEWVIRQRPDVLYLSGAPTYKLFYQAERDADTLTAPDIRTARANLLTIMKYTGCQVILDHYLVRDPNFRRLYSEVFATGRVQTAAEYLGVTERPLEAQRRNQASRDVETLTARSPRARYEADQQAAALAAMAKARTTPPATPEPRERTPVLAR